MEQTQNIHNIQLPETKIVEYPTAKDLAEKYFLGNPIEEIESVGDEYGNEMSPLDMLEAIQQPGCWAFANTHTNEINLWINRKNVKMSTLIAMLAHEKAHFLPEEKNFPEEIYDEMLAEEYSQIAVWAYETARGLLRKPYKQEVKPCRLNF